MGRHGHGRHADGSGEPVCLRLSLGNVGPLPAVVVVAVVACKSGCNTAAHGRSLDRSRRWRYNWGHNTCAGEAHLVVHEQQLVRALPPPYAMRMMGRMVAPSARM